jgi:hypothetical protein
MLIQLVMWLCRNEDFVEITNGAVIFCYIIVNFSCYFLICKQKFWFQKRKHSQLALKCSRVHIEMNYEKFKRSDRPDRFRSFCQLIMFAIWYLPQFGNLFIQSAAKCTCTNFILQKSETFLCKSLGNHCYISCVFIGYKNVFGPIAVLVTNHFQLEQKSYRPLKFQFMSRFR